MTTQAWKDLERTVAKHFNTSRRLRGADFSEKDIEIIATLRDWLGWDNDAGVAVECKYRKNHPLIDLITKHEPYNNTIFVARIGDYILCWLDDFDEVFLTFFLSLKGTPHIDELTTRYSIAKIDKQVPGYLEEYREQARGYTKDTDEVLLPVVCMAKAKSSHRLMAVHLDDIEKFSIEFNKCQSVVHHGPKLPQKNVP